MGIDLSQNAERALKMVREADLLVFDTETSGLDWRQHSPIGYVVGAPVATGAAGTGAGGVPAISIAAEDVVYVPVRHGGGGNIMGGVPLSNPEQRDWDIHPFEKELAKAFDDRNRIGRGRIVGHHIKFDCHFAANAGIMLGRKLADTQDQAAILNEYRRSFSLAEVAKDYGVEAKKGEALYQHMSQMFGGPPDKKQMSSYWRLPGIDPIAYEYAVGDGVTTMQVYAKQIAQIAQEDLQVVADLEADLIWTLFRCERKGIKVDMDAIDELQHETERMIARDIEEIGIGFNVRSPNMMMEYFKRHGITNWPTTEKGNPSFTEKWLKKTPEGRKIVAIRQKSNLLNTFIRPLRERHIWKGRVHANLNQLKSDSMGTISGRFSCNNPNLQQVPKRIKEIAIPFRKMFVPDEGKIFWERDWSQCEPRLFAHYSGDTNLVEGYNSKPFRDAHSVVAELLNVERDPTAKRMNMGIFTGMQPPAFSVHMGWDLERAEAAHRKWFEEFPAIRQFQRNAKTRLKNRGYVMTLLKRRCRLESPQYAYRGTSKIIQGSNADIAKYKMLEMDLACEQAGDIVEILMTVHDSFNGQREDTPAAKELLDELVRIMEDVQGEPFNLRVPFVAEGYEGKNWAVASFGDDV